MSRPPTVLRLEVVPPSVLEHLRTPITPIVFTRIRTDVRPRIEGPTTSIMPQVLQYVEEHPEVLLKNEPSLEVAKRMEVAQAKFVQAQALKKLPQDYTEDDCIQVGGAVG